MTVDLRQFQAAFFDEAAEHLVELERLLLGVDLERSDAELINEIFRAAHSIKGGANMFGLTAIASVTHEMETLLDAVRRGKLRMTRAIIDEGLRACDFLRSALADGRSGLAADKARAAALAAKLRSVAEVVAPASPPAATAEEAAPMAERLEIDWPAGKDRGAEEVGELVLQVARLLGIEAAQARELEEALLRRGSGQITVPASSDAKAAKDGLVFVLPEECVRVVEGEVVDFGFFEENLPEQLSERKELAATETGAQERPATAASDMVSIRVSAHKIDRLINLTGELMIGHSMMRSGIGGHGLSEQLGVVLASLERNIRELQEAALSIRMIPIEGVFARFPRLVHDLSAHFGKEVELRIEGESTELDRGLVEKLVDPLTHLIRNSLDHGIESPGARERAGKPRRGVVWLRASHESGSVVIEVADDGAGLSRERILSRATEQGLAVDPGMSDLAVWELIFAPGFSTAAQISEVSGRGVGMDVVRRNVRQLGGQVEISTEPGKGTRTVVRLPLTLAIMDGMELAVGDEVYIAPLSAIVESLRPAAHELKSIARDARVLNLRGEVLPVLSLAKVLGMERDRGTEDGVLVVVESGGRRAALAADALLGQQQIVVKNLEANFRKVSGVAGATILGNGTVSLILDIPELMRRALGRDDLLRAAAA
jgi:two-component system chemotaxis sensor kinase CheA